MLLLRFLSTTDLSLPAPRRFDGLIAALPRGRRQQRTPVREDQQRQCCNKAEALMRVLFTAFLLVSRGSAVSRH
jgi:hypothetical protein